MGLPAPLLEVLDELGQQAAAVAAVGSSPTPVDEAQEQAKTIESILAKARPTAEAMFSQIEGSVREVGAAAAPMIEAAIEQIGHREVDLAAQWKPILELSRSAGKQTFRARGLTPAERSRQVLVLERLAKALSGVLRLFRDERWRMLTLLAEISPAGDAPVFDGPDQLVEHLRANRR